jgi:hypothetical protein
MLAKRILEKGVEWIVHEDGRISTDPHQIKVTRLRNGVWQEYTHSVPGKTLSPCLTKSGYLEVSKKIGPNRVKVLLHRLIGMAFVEGFQPGLTINHINGIKTDNRPENLEWVSLSENTKHQWRTGLVDLRGENCHTAKLTSRQVVYIRRLLRQGVSQNALSVVAGVSSSTIQLIAHGKRWASVPDDAAL